MTKPDRNELPVLMAYWLEMRETYMHASDKEAHSWGQFGFFAGAAMVLQMLHDCRDTKGDALALEFAGHLMNECKEYTAAVQSGDWSAFGGNPSSGH